MRAAWLIAGWVCLTLTSPTFAQDAPSFAEIAQELRTSMAQRKVAESKTHLEALRKAATTDADKQTLERLDHLHGYWLDFWKAVHEGGVKLQGADELTIGGKLVSIVEYDASAGRLVLRVEGQNKRYTLFDMPPKVAIVMAEQVLRKGAPQNETFIGAFLAMDGRGDRQLAREAWQRAQRQGIDVAYLLPELNEKLPAAATVVLPQLTADTAKFLRPALWQLAQQKNARWKKAALGRQGVQNTQGQLEVTVPGEVDAAWVVFGRKAPANFGVRIYLSDLPEGQKFGLFNEKADEAADVSVSLPSGVAKVEFARRDGKFICSINDEVQEVTIHNAAAAKSSGLLGFSLPADAKVVVAGCEFQQ